MRRPVHSFSQPGASSFTPWVPVRDDGVMATALTPGEDTGRYSHAHFDPHALTESEGGPTGSRVHSGP